MWLGRCRQLGKLTALIFTFARSAQNVSQFAKFGAFIRHACFGSFEADVERQCCQRQTGETAQQSGCFDELFTRDRCCYPASESTAENIEDHTASEAPWKIDEADAQEPACDHTALHVHSLHLAFTLVGGGGCGRVLATRQGKRESTPLAQNSNRTWLKTFAFVVVLTPRLKSVLAQPCIASCHL